MSAPRAPARPALAAGSARARLLALGGLLTGALLGAGAGADETAPCRAEVSLEPARAWVEQQVIYRVRVLRSPDVADVRWVVPPSFRSMRAEWLPGRAPTAPRRALGPSHRLVHEERRALFPLRAGRLTTPAARMECRVEREGRAHHVGFDVPPVPLEVMPLPEEGRPPDFTGVVGRVQLRTALAHNRIHVGESVRLSVNVWGAANVWRVPPPLGDPARIEGADVFAEPPELALDAGERLVARRAFRYALVPREPGEIVVPPVRVPWFDPETAGYRVERTDALRVRVLPPLVGPPEPAPGEAERLRPYVEPPARPLGPLLVAFALLVAGAWAVTRLARAVQDRLEGRRRAAAEAVRAPRDGHAPDREAEAWAQALHDALRRRGVAPGATPAELASDPHQDPAVREAAGLLAELERVRFSPRADRGARGSTGGGAPAANGIPDRDRAAHGGSREARELPDRDRLARALEALSR